MAKYLINRNDNLYVDHEKGQPKMDKIDDFMAFIRFQINYKFCFVMNHQLDCPSQLIFAYN